jgi:hypothetical protein
VPIHCSSGIGVTGDSAFSNNLSVGGTLTLAQGAQANYILQSIDNTGKAKWVSPTGIGGYTASNGLSLAGVDFKLGGLLSQNTDIGFSGFSLNFSDTGSTLVSFSSSSNTFYNPTNFAAAGDVSMAYDLNLTNSIGSNINSSGPLSLNSGEVFNSSNLTLKTYNSGKIILNSSNLWNDGTNLGIGTTNPLYALDVMATGTTLVARFSGSNNTGCTINDGGVISCSSDSRLKKNIDNTNYGLDILSSLRPVEFNWNFEDNTASKNLGFIAQEVESLIPELVTTDQNGFKQLNTIGLTPIIVKSIQEQQSQINDLSNEASTQETLVNDKISDFRSQLEQFVSKELVAQSSSWDTSIASDSAQLSGDLAVNGNTQLYNAFITGTFTTGQIAIRDNFIETTNSDLYIQGSGTGNVHILGDILVINENGDINITGNINLNGTLTAQNASISGSLVSNNINTNEIQSMKLNIATDSAQVIIADSGFASESTVSAQLISNASAGTVSLPIGKTELIIKNNKLTTNSMVFLTPNGSTQNQVVYVKEKGPESFTIAIDKALETDLSINWWIIN